MILRRHTVICREGWYYLLVLGVVVGGALMREINLLIVIAGMMLGPLLYNWREVVASLKGLQAERRLPDGICAGDLLVVDIQLVNKSRRYGSSAVVVEDPIRREGSRGPVDRSRGEILFPNVPAGESRSLSYHGRVLRRGRYRFGPLRISTRYPLGLVRRTLTIENVKTMIVCPRLGYLTPAWSSLNQQTLRGARRVVRQQNVVEPDFFGLREWQHGDSIRSIHWRTSARRGELLVKQSEQQLEQDLLLLVDLWQPRSPSLSHLQAVEQAISFAATVVAQLCRHGGSQLDVGLGGSAVMWSQGPASMARMGELMEQLAVIEAHRVDRLPDLIRLSRRGIRKGTATLIVSTRAVDLNDIERFGNGRDGTLPSQLRISPTVCVDASSEELQTYFCLDEPALLP